MSEQYYWWWNSVRKLSRSEIKKMKENMQKIPLIQEKSNKYHHLEEEKAENLLKSIIDETEQRNDNLKEENEQKNLWLIQKIKKYLFW